MGWKLPIKEVELSMCARKKLYPSPILGKKEEKLKNKESVIHEYILLISGFHSNFILISHGP